MVRFDLLKLYDYREWIQKKTYQSWREYKNNYINLIMVRFDLLKLYDYREWIQKKKHINHGENIGKSDALIIL